MKNEDIVILAARRSPFGKFGGALKGFTVPQLAAPIVDVMLESLPLRQIDRLILGQALSAGGGQHVARQIVRLSRNIAPPWDDECKAHAVNRVCNSSLQALWEACNYARDGGEVVAVVGAESMSQAPYLWPRPHGLYGDVNTENSQNLTRAIASLKGGENGVCVNKFPDMADSILHDGLLDAYLEGNPHMGEIADSFSREIGITREMQDLYAFDSHRKAFMAKNVPFRGLVEEFYPIEDDEGVRQPNLESISQLAPVFGENITAGSASQLSDGAVAMIVASYKVAKLYRLKPLARVIAFADVAGGNDRYLEMPAYVARATMHKCKLLSEDIGAFEVHEPFAVGPLHFISKFDHGFHLTREVFMDKMNIWGGSIAVGHPLGATGARLVVNLVHALPYKRERYGLAVACNGGGEAMAVIIENLQK